MTSMLWAGAAITFRESKVRIKEKPDQSSFPLKKTEELQVLADQLP